MLHLKKMIILCCVLILVSVAFFYAGFIRKTNEVQILRRSVLIDSYHAHNYNRGLDPLNYDYHSLHGSLDLMNFMRSQGFEVEEHFDGHLNSKSLENHGILFINLVSDDLPGFTVPEIRDIQQFVKDGGHLIVITDHSNCYNHAHKLEPLFLELGLKIYKETACDTGENTIGTGNGWVLLNHFKNHPITVNLESVVFQTGGTVDDQYAVATLSENGWGDYYEHIPWGHVSNRGFFGNWSREDFERQGKLGTILAKELDKGKIVVIGDQNLIGNFWLKYADNYKLIVNMLNWMFQEDIDYQDFVHMKKDNVLFLENYTTADFGITESLGYYHLFFATAKRFWTFASDKIEGDYGLIVLTDNSLPLNEENRLSILRHIERKKPIVFLNKYGELNDSGFEFVKFLTEETNVDIAYTENTKSVDEHLDKGQFVVILNAETYSNLHIHHPTSTPTKQEVDTLSTFFDIINRIYVYE
jgi:signal recognition particle receptor subunit beta